MLHAFKSFTTYIRANIESAYCVVVLAQFGRSSEEYAANGNLKFLR